VSRCRLNAPLTRYKRRRTVVEDVVVEAKGLFGVVLAKVRTPTVGSKTHSHGVVPARGVGRPVGV
jgi:hypothetical protein